MWQPVSNVHNYNWKDQPLTHSAPVYFTDRSKILPKPVPVTFMGACLRRFLSWLEFSFQLYYPLKGSYCIMCICIPILSLKVDCYNFVF